MHHGAIAVPFLGICWGFLEQKDGTSLTSWKILGNLWTYDENMMEIQGDQTIKIKGAHGLLFLMALG